MFCDHLGNEWLSINEASRLSDFSVPFIMALLNSSLFPGRVLRTNGGRRLVNKDDFTVWIEVAGSQIKTESAMIKTVADVRQGVRAEDLE